MNRTSRRKFGKQLTGALAALPLAALASEQNTAAQLKAQDQSKKTSTEEIKTSHNTPPPVLISDGSFILETEEAVFDSTEMVQNQRKKYKRHPKITGKTKVYMAHLKILDGSGEILFRGDYHDPNSDLRIAVLTEDGTVNLSTVANKFQIDTPSSKNLMKATDPLDQPMGTKRRGRFRYKDDDSSNLPGISNVKVTKGSSAAVFGVDLSDLPDRGRELKIMIWLAEV